MRSFNVLGALLFLGTVAAQAEIPRGDGSQTGDGATAFTGLAQMPEANMYLGAASTSIAIEVPPGRNGLTPAIALTYSGSGTPSAYGVGWDLPIGAIHCTSQHGILACDHSTGWNEFVVSLPGQSIECVMDGAVCRPNIEESFAKVVRRGESGADNRWEVWDRAGTKYYFGAVNAASVDGSSFNLPARTGSSVDQAYRTVASPLGCESTSSWALTAIEDTNGNRIDYRYLAVDGVLYPWSIRYGDKVAANHKFQVRFFWENRSFGDAPAVEDFPVNGIRGFASSLQKRLERVEVHFQNRTVRAYDFAYYEDSGGQSNHREARQSVLAGVTLLDGNLDALERQDGQPAQTLFHYQEHSSTGSRFGFGPEQVVPGMPSSFRMGVRARSAGRSFRETLDMNGDGFLDFVDTHALFSNDCPSGPQTWKVYLGSRNGFTASTIDWSVPEGSVLCNIREVGQWCGGDTCTRRDTFDIDGDGFPDFVDASFSSTAWKIYFGDPHAVNGSWGFLPPVTWEAPFYGMRRSAQAEFHGDPGTAEFIELRDMNADGLADLVRTSFPGTGNWQVWFNRGRTLGLDTTPTDFSAPLNVLAFSLANDAQQVLGTFDVNGDGLVDQVHASTTGQWQVHYNSGREIGARSAIWSFSPFGRGLWAMRRVESGTVYRDFFDINGDSLPDIVDARENGTGWDVLLNRGAGFAPSPVHFAAPYSGIRDDSGGIDTLDMDGDGLVDHVQNGTTQTGLHIAHNLGGAWEIDPASAWMPYAPVSNLTLYAAVQENAFASRPDLLVGLENGVGAETTITYRPSTQWDNTGGDAVSDLSFNTWTVTRIEQDDGMCSDANPSSCLVNGAGHTLVTNFRYQDGRYDPVDREFRGFFLVTQENGDPEDPAHAGALTYFHQSTALAGRVMSSWVFDASGGGSLWTKPLSATVSTWGCADPISGVGMTCPETMGSGDRTWVRLVGSEQYAFSSYSLGYGTATITANEAWHPCGGSVARQSVWDTEGTMTLTTEREFACLDSESAYIADRPIHEKVFAGDPNFPLAERWFRYDGPAGQPLGLGQVTKGNLTLTEDWLDQSVVSPGACSQASSKQCVTARREVDDVGNVTRTIDANGRVTQTEYDPETRIYPYVTTNALGHKIGTRFDPGCGTPLWRTITYTAGTPEAQAKAVRAYDSFCRLERTAFPDEDINTSPHERYVYKLSGEQTPGVIARYTREPNHGSGTVLATTLSDGFGRMLQQKRESVVDGAWKFVAAATVIHDSRGNIVSQYSPFVFANLAQFETYTEPDASAGLTQITYDAAGRQTTVTHPDGNRRESDYSLVTQTTTKDECYTAAGCTGGKTVEKRDPFGRVTETWVYEEGDSLRARSKNTYDELGRLLVTVQGDPQAPAGQWLSNTEVHFAYDTLGRKVFHHDPDSGDWTYGYDAAGNLLFQDDPKSDQHAQYCYDAINRRTLDCVLDEDFAGAPSLIQSNCSQTCGSSEVRLTYDQTAIGGTTIPYGLGRLTQVTDPTGWTRWMEFDVRGREKRVDKQIDGIAATTRYVFDAADHITQMTYPDGEVVQFLYDAVGNVRSVRNSTTVPTYLSSLTYDIHGRPRSVVHGNQVTDTRTYGNAAQNFRPSSLVASKPGTTWLSLSYTGYTPTGMLSSISDLGPKPNGAMNATASYSYDGLGRLTAASGPQVGAHSFQYDHLGNLRQMNAIALSYTQSRPHAADRLNNQPLSVQHDENGNRTKRLNDQFRYDKRDRLEAINVSQAQFEYDHAGARVRTETGNAITRHFNQYFEVAGPKTFKYYFAGPLLVASREVTTPAQFSALTDPGAIQVAAVSLGAPGIRVLLGPDARNIALFGTFALFAGLTLAPWHRRRSVGVRLRHGHLIGVSTVLLLTTTPWPLAVSPAFAGGVGSGAPPVHYYHSDHLGTVHLITTQDGTVASHIRYSPFGGVRGRFGSSGISLPGNARDRFEFTGYQTETSSGLQFAGSRYYDPTLGMFLTHDPQGQFPNPYAYGGWNPVNGADPGGQFFFLIPAAAAFASQAVVAAASLVTTAVVTTVTPIVSALSTWGGLQAVGGAILKGAALGALRGLGQGLLAGVTSGDYSGVLGAVKDGAISGAMSGLLDGVGVSDALGTLGPQKVASVDDLGTFSNFVGEGAMAGAIKGAFGAVGDAASGKSFSKSLVSGVMGGARSGALSALHKMTGGNITKSLFEDQLKPYAQKAADFVGVPLEFNPSPDSPTNFRTLAKGAYEGYVAGVLSGLPSAPGEFIQELAVSHNLTLSKVGSILSNGGEKNIKNLGDVQKERFLAHHTPSWAGKIIEMVK